VPQRGIWEKVTSFFGGSGEDTVVTETVKIDVDATNQETVQETVQETFDVPKIEVIESVVISTPASADPVQTNDENKDTNIQMDVTMPRETELRYRGPAEDNPNLSVSPIVTVQVAQPPPFPAQREQYANHQIERPEIAIPCFKNLPTEVLYELIRDGQMFSPDIFEENYNALPDEFKSRYTYEPVQMIIDDVPEILAFRMIRRFNNDNDDDDDDDDDESDEE
jgi:hypothetical protein